MSAQRVAIVGTVGVPARYGGFETLADQLASHVDPSQVHFYIYCQRSAYARSERVQQYKGHRCIYVPLPANGVASLLYDAIALLDAIVIRRCSTLLCLGVSGAFMFPLLRVLFPRRKIILNVDGLESRRAVWGWSAKLLLATLEWIGVKTAHEIIADNRVIRTLVRRRYARSSCVIAYGGDHASIPTPLTAHENVGDYFLSISRIVPENNVELILKSFAQSKLALVYIGNWNASVLGCRLRDQYRSSANLRLLDPIYDTHELARWRANAIAYVHGHSVGGTNPALVEALFWARSILAFDCGFNRATLKGRFNYWRDSSELADLARGGSVHPTSDDVADLRADYMWRQISARYAGLFR